jgi:hypothetical protein
MRGDVADREHLKQGEMIYELRIYTRPIGPLTSSPSLPRP